MAHIDAGKQLLLKSSILYWQNHKIGEVHGCSKIGWNKTENITTSAAQLRP